MELVQAEVQGSEAAQFDPFPVGLQRDTAHQDTELLTVWRGSAEPLYVGLCPQKMAPTSTIDGTIPGRLLDWKAGLQGPDNLTW